MVLKQIKDKGGTKQLIEKDTERWEVIAFYGDKTESTATWHGMFLSNGNSYTVDVMHYCWKGEWPKNRAPSIKHFPQR